MTTDLLFGIATGVIIFLYGIEGFSREIRAIAGDNLRRLLSKWTRNRFFGMMLGALVTAVIQSSTATSVLAVSLVNAAIINFHQSLGIILGTNIGTTVTAFLVAYKLTHIGPWFIIIGFLLSITRVKYSFIGKALFYFGLVFFALSELSQITTEIKSNEFFASVFVSLGSPLYALVAGCLVTILVQSSSVTIGLIVILVQSQALDLTQAIPIIFGANIGTTFTGILASLSMDTFARRAAAANTIFNIGGVIIFFPFIPIFIELITDIGGTPGQMTALAHLFFNLGSSFFFLLFLSPLAWISTKVVQGDDDEIVFETSFIDKDKGEGFDKSVSLLELEIAHYLTVAKKMLSSAVSYVDLHTKKGLDRLEKYYSYSNHIAKKCEAFLHSLARKDVTSEQAAKLVKMFRMVDYLQQTMMSQRQIAEIPELDRLPQVEQLTYLKAELFNLSNQIIKIYDHLERFLKTHDQSELEQIAAIEESVLAAINDKYQRFITEDEETPERIRSFFFGFITKIQSMTLKLKALRTFAESYFLVEQRPNLNR